MSEAATPTQTDVLRALSSVNEPQTGRDLVTLGLVSEIKICEGNVAFQLHVGPPGSPEVGQLAAACRSAVAQVPGVTRVEVRPAGPPPGARPVATQQVPAAPPRPGAAPPSAGPSIVPGVRHIIAVGSGKGGVGKSTVAVNLAVALAMDGHQVGLLDADVYGPSIPTMMGIRDQPGTSNGKLQPLTRHGVKLMSLGFLMPDDTAHVIWRGPMVGSAVRQMLADCDCGELDYLLVDLPPGTGDAQLTLAQSVPITGAVVVMTSQDVAVNIASKAIGMFRKLNVPILGVVGNMDSFVCPCCNTQTAIFTRGGSEAGAQRMDVPFLGSIPLDPATVEHGDHGIPTVMAAPSSPQADAFRAVARSVSAAIEAADSAEPEKPNPLAGLLGRFQKS